MKEAIHIAKKWEMRTNLMFNSPIYKIGNSKNKVRFSLSPRELEELFQIGDTAMIRSQWREVANLMRETYKAFDWRKIELDGQTVSVEFTVKRYPNSTQDSTVTPKYFKKLPALRRFESVDEIKTCTNLERLTFWKADNYSFLKGLLCENNEAIRTQTLLEQKAIKERLSVLPTLC